MKSLSLAASLIASWLAIHLLCIFLWKWTLAGALLAVPVVLAQTWLSTGLFIVAHDCMHGSLAPGRPRLNRAVGTFALTIYAGLSYGRVAPMHFRHHAAPGTATDPDYNPLNSRSLAPWLLRFFASYYTHAQILRITIAACAYMLLGASLVNIVVFWAVPALLALVQLFVFGTYLPHRDGGAAFSDGHRARSNGFSPITALITCFNFGSYHHEHHIHPGVPWWALPSVRPAVKRSSSPRSVASSAAGRSLH